MKPRVSLFNYEVDPLTMEEAVSQVLEWTAAPDGLCRFVVTPNVNHTVLLERHAGLRDAYREAGLILVDGMPIYVAARLFGRAVPGRVAGSDLVPRLFDAAERVGGIRTYLLGAGPGVAPRAARQIEAHWPKCRVVGTRSPPKGFEHDRRENDSILNEIEKARPDVLVVGLGAPKQELWVHAHRPRLKASVALCVGAAIDFLAGEKRRAPAWMRHVGLEWLHRAGSEPRRLLRRYGRDACAFTWLLCRYWCSVRGKSTCPS
jgi:N-acetylglucosaminyldiphosphoundecaprenol N-acetyl-beta-D-mannosaminyltransferase